MAKDFNLNLYRVNTINSGGEGREFIVLAKNISDCGNSIDLTTCNYETISKISLITNNIKISNDTLKEIKE